MTIYLRVVLAAVLYCNGLLFSQIAITEADFAATIEVGDTLRSFSEGDFTLVDIGSPGATSWDFSELNADSSSSDFFSVDPSSTPFIADFPEASHAFQLTIEVQVREFDFFLYNLLQSSAFKILGSVTMTPVGVGRLRFVPPEIQFQFPLTYGSAWTQRDSIFTETIYDGVVVSTSGREVVKIGSRCVWCNETARWYHL